MLNRTKNKSGGGFDFLEQYVPWVVCAETLSISRLQCGETCLEVHMFTVASAASYVGPWKVVSYLGGSGGFGFGKSLAVIVAPPSC